MATEQQAARLARSYARGHRYGQIGPLEDRRFVRLAFSTCGRVLLGDDVHRHVHPMATVRIWLRSSSGFMAIEGQAQRHGDEGDGWQWSQMHPGTGMYWALEPDLVLWNSERFGPHAFLGPEWMLPVGSSAFATREFIEHLNACHRERVEALVSLLADGEGKGGRIVSIDREGLSVTLDGRQFHRMAFRGDCFRPEDVRTEIDGLLDAAEVPAEPLPTPTLQRARPH